MFSIVEDFHYYGRCSLWRMFSTMGDVQCCGGCSVLWEDTLSTLEGVQCGGGIPSLLWRVFSIGYGSIVSTVEEYHLLWRLFSNDKGNTGAKYFPQFVYFQEMRVLFAVNTWGYIPNKTKMPSEWDILFSRSRPQIRIIISKCGPPTTQCLSILDTSLTVQCTGGDHGLYCKREAKPFRTEGRLGVLSLLRCLGMCRCRSYTIRLFHHLGCLCSNIEGVQLCGGFHQSISTVEGYHQHVEGSAP